MSQEKVTITELKALMDAREAIVLDGRSERAAAILRNAGWKDARWLESGYMGWVEAGFPDYGPGFASS
jgi:rhodanese-related sulfurtransferase